MGDATAPANGAAAMLGNDPTLPRSWPWWAMRAVVQQQRLLSSPAAALHAELHQLAPQVPRTRFT